MIFKTSFAPSVCQYQNAKVLRTGATPLLDNAPSHPSESSMITKDGHYLPPNVTFLIQSMNQKVIPGLKQNYKNIFLCFLLKENCARSMKEALQKYATIADYKVFKRLPSSST